MATAPKRTARRVSAPESSYRFSGAHKHRTLRSTHMSIIALVTALIAVPTMPIFLGYFLGSISIACASVVLARNRNHGMTSLAVIVAWASLALSILAMIAHLSYMLFVSPNYM